MSLAFGGAGREKSAEGQVHNLTQGATVGLPTLFILVFAMGLNRVLDLFTIEQKLEQMEFKETGWRNERFTFALMRKMARRTKNARTVLVCFKILMRVRKEYYMLLGLLILVVFTFLGLSILVSNEVRNGSGVALSFVMASVTALVSVFTSLLNLAIEKVKVYL